jgi:regulator of sirC expression with transglutaminase-like and TPR domain
MENKEIKALLSLLDDNDSEVFNHVEDKIISMGEVMIPFLEHEWESNFNPHVQKRIEDLIHSLQLSAFKQRLQDWKDNETPNLLKGLWAVATYQYPDLDYKKLKKDVDKIYYEAWLTHRPYASPFDQVKNLNQIIFDKFSFTRNVQNPNTPSNSMINIVVESKRGNPIALCIVYMLVAQRLKMPVFGVNLPNLFVLTYKSDETQFYINAFNRGMIFSRTDIDDYIAKLNIPTNTIFYEPCQHLDIVLRVLRNLTMSFEYLGDADKVAELKDVLKMLS